MQLEGYDRRGGDREQLVVQGDDLRPISLLECRILVSSTRLPDRACNAERGRREWVAGFLGDG